jgi:hypothetical protein
MGAAPSAQGLVASEIQPALAHLGDVDQGSQVPGWPCNGGRSDQGAWRESEAEAETRQRQRGEGGGEAEAEAEAEARRRRERGRRRGRRQTVVANWPCNSR